MQIWMLRLSKRGFKPGLFFSGLLSLPIIFIIFKALGRSGFNSSLYSIDYDNEFSQQTRLETNKGKEEQKKGSLWWELLGFTLSNFPTSYNSVSFYKSMYCALYLWYYLSLTGLILTTFLHPANHKFDWNDFLKYIHVCVFRNWLSCVTLYNPLD